MVEYSFTIIWKIVSCNDNSNDNSELKNSERELNYVKSWEYFVNESQSFWKFQIYDSVRIKDV